MLGVHASAQAIIHFGKVARKQNLTGVCLDSLSRLENQGQCTISLYTCRISLVLRIEILEDNSFAVLTITNSFNLFERFCSFKSQMTHSLSHWANSDCSAWANGELSSDPEYTRSPVCPSWTVSRRSDSRSNVISRCRGWWGRMSYRRWVYRVM